VVLKLRQIEVQTAQGKSLALACEKAEIPEQSCYRWPPVRSTNRIASIAWRSGVRGLW